MSKDFSTIKTLGDYCAPVRQFVAFNASRSNVSVDDSTDVATANRYGGSSSWMQLGEEGTLTDNVSYDETLHILTTTTAEGSLISIAHLLPASVAWKTSGKVSDSHSKELSASVEKDKTMFVPPLASGTKPNVIQLAEMIANGDLVGVRVRKYGTVVRLSNASTEFSQNGETYKVGESYCRSRSLYCECK